MHTHADTGPGWLIGTTGTRLSPYPPTTVIMPQFSQHKNDNTKWYSQHFYSWPQGYKLCLCVDAKGAGSGKQTHVSVSVLLMKGENYSQLQ